MLPTEQVEAALVPLHHVDFWFLAVPDFPHPQTRQALEAAGAGETA